MTALLVFLGGALGALARYLTDRWVQRRTSTRLPLGTLTVNVVGCLILGGLTGAVPSLPDAVAPLAATGFTGALTTYSTLGYETVELLRERRHGTALAYLALSLGLGLVAAALGILATRAILG